MARFGLPAAGVVATVALAVAVAAWIKREPPNFSALPAIAILRDADAHPIWAVRVAPAAHQIAVDAFRDPVPPPGHAYQLWLATGDGPHSLGLLPAHGRKVAAELPWLMPQLAGAGELLVSLEPARGSDQPRPSGPIAFRAPLGGSG